MSNLTVEFVIGVGSAIAGGLIILFTQVLTDWIRERRGDYTGEWEDEIFDDQGGIVKRDRMYLRQRGEEITGTISRFYPEDQKHRTWKVYGRIRGTDFFAVFWSVNKSYPSYGCWYVHQMNDSVFSGHYLRLSEIDGRTVAPVPLKLVRLPRK